MHNVSFRSALVFLFAALFFPKVVFAAILSLSPSTGTFEVGGMLETSIFLDSGGSIINAIEATVTFPPDKLQLITPTTGNSIISLWTSQPRVDNQSGSVHLQGVIPGGTNISRGIVTTLRFRIKAPGDALVKFKDQNATRVLLHDGNGTDVLNNVQNAVFSLRLPPPLGPVVASPTHPDESRWYSVKTAVLKWASELSDISGYSYALSDDPVDSPDDVSEGNTKSVSYKNLSDGTHYFHIKALHESSWGGVTHFAVNLDSMPPAEFPVEVLPSQRTNSRNPILQFFTTDTLSGMDHYEVKVVSLSPPIPEGEPLFVEASSLFVAQELTIGDYDAIVRAYDKAGNYRDVIQHFSIVTPLLRYVDEKGVHVFGEDISWLLLVFLLLLLVAILYCIERFLKHRRYDTEHHDTKGAMPEDIKNKLEELKKYHQKYGKIATILLVILFGSFFADRAYAQTEKSFLAPPVLDAVARDISNEDIFYAGGKVNVTGSEVVLYLQNIQTGEVITEKVLPNTNGEWFYRNGGFLAPGDYIFWAQAKIDGEISPPSPENRVSVRETALTLGSSRLSYEFIYLALIFLLLIVISILIVNIIIHARNARKQKTLWLVEVREAEESVRSGFTELRRDILAELAIVQKAKMSKEVSIEEREREKELLEDLDRISAHIGKEVFDIEKAVA